MSDFPQIGALLICEDLRPEPGNKQTILGFYGVAPEVDIVAADASKALPRIAFLFAAKEAKVTKKISLTVHIRGPKNEEIAHFENQPFDLIAGKRVHVGLGVVGFQLAGPGQYRVILEADGKVESEQTFNVVNAQAEQ